jgi:hypothetical protein
VEHDGSAQRWMAGKRQLDARREYSHPDVATLLGRPEEHRLGEVHLACQGLHVSVGQTRRVGEDREPVALERASRKDVTHDVRETHFARILAMAGVSNPW